MLKGDKFEVWFTVEESVYNSFRRTFKDENPLHTDKKFAAEKGFPDKVMYGNILNGFLSYFIGECLPMKNVIIQTQEIKFMKPVFLHDKLCLQVVVSDFFESVNTYEFKYHFSNQDGVKVSRGKIQIGLLI